jgi:glyoxylase-like metal-dependent hydrolase (beta-lactamase superfamily II)
MKEIVPGVFHWTAPHPRIKMDVASYFLAESGTLLDPMVPPDEGLDWFRDGREPQRIVLTNRHHHRDSQQFVEAFELGPVLVPESGLHEYEGKELDVTGYVVGEEVASGIVCHEVGAICPDDMALEIRSAGALAMADGLIRYGELMFVPDNLMDEPEKTKQGLLESFRELLDLDFDTLLFAHGEPLVGGAKEALRGFVEKNSA